MNIAKMRNLCETYYLSTLTVLHVSSNVLSVSNRLKGLLVFTDVVTFWYVRNNSYFCEHI